MMGLEHREHEEHRGHKEHSEGVPAAGLARVKEFAFRSLITSISALEIWAQLRGSRHLQLHRFGGRLRLHRFGCRLRLHRFGGRLCLQWPRSGLLLSPMHLWTAAPAPWDGSR